MIQKHPKNIKMVKKEASIESEMIEDSREEAVEEAKVIKKITKAVNVAVGFKRSMIEPSQKQTVCRKRTNQKKVSPMIRISMKRSSR